MACHQPILYERLDTMYTAPRFAFNIPSTEKLQLCGMNSAHFCMRQGTWLCGDCDAGACGVICSSLTEVFAL